MLLTTSGHAVVEIGVTQAVMGSSMLVKVACGQVMQVPGVQVGEVTCPDCHQQTASLPRLKRAVTAKTHAVIDKIGSLRGDLRRGVTDLLSQAIMHPEVINLIVEATGRHDDNWKIAERVRQISEIWNVIECMPQK